MLGGYQVSTSSASLSAAGPSLLYVPGWSLKGARLRHCSRFSLSDPPGPSPSPLLPSELHSLGCPAPPSPTSLEKEFLTRSPSNHKSRPLRYEAGARWTVTRSWHLARCSQRLVPACPGHSTSQKRSPRSACLDSLEPTYVAEVGCLRASGAYTESSMQRYFQAFPGNENADATQRC